MSESYNVGDLVHILYDKCPVALGVWMGSETLGRGRKEAFAKIFQLDKGEIIYFEKDDFYTFRLASSIKTNDYSESRK